MGWCSPAFADGERAGPDLSFKMGAGEENLPEGWKPLVFRKIKRHTRYRIEEDNGRFVVHAVSEKSASGLVFSYEGDAARLPVLRWKWKIGGTLEKGDARFKEGDDFAARIYVVFKYDSSRAGLGTKLKYELARKLEGRYPPDSSLNYVWANKLPKGAMIPNAFTGRAIMIAVESGDEKAGQWVEEKVDILADYRKAFNTDPPPIEGVAIMTDTDNTQGRAEAWYAEIGLSAQ